MIDASQHFINFLAVIRRIVVNKAEFGYFSDGQILDQAVSDEPCRTVETIFYTLFRRPVISTEKDLGDRKILGYIHSGDDHVFDFGVLHLTKYNIGYFGA